MEGKADVLFFWVAARPDLCALALRVIGRARDCRRPNDATAPIVL
jgi:hypothetical protein